MLARLVVVALVLPLAFAGALPTLARALGGPAPHVCRCELRGGHSTCACPICNPDRDDLRLTEASIHGQCGDDDVAFGGALAVAIVPTGLTRVLPADRCRALVSSRDEQRADIPRTPPTPPPRAPG